MDHSSPDDWVADSDELSKPILRVYAKNFPEAGASLGLTGYDHLTRTLAAEDTDHIVGELKGIATELRPHLEADCDGPAAAEIRDDVRIMLRELDVRIDQLQTERALLLPYWDVGQIVYQGLAALAGREPIPREAIANRLNRYAGLVDGLTPLTAQAEAITRSALAERSLLPPPSRQVRLTLDSGPALSRFVTSVGARLGLDDAATAIAIQLEDYASFLRHDILPRSERRTDPGLPDELFRLELRSQGVDATPAELIELGTAWLQELRLRLQEQSREVARRLRLPDNDFHTVLGHLKQTGFIQQKNLLAHYRKLAAHLDMSIRDAGVVTLPDYELALETADEAAGTSSPTPHYRRGSLVGDTYEPGTLMIPGAVMNTGGGTFDAEDFNFDAVTWVICAHEGRPGHDVQYWNMLRGPMSRARKTLGLNSVSAEGWGLYAEALVEPFLPPESALVLSHARVLRAGRCFIEPMFHAGALDEVAVADLFASEFQFGGGMVQAELDRYAFGAPGQSTSYFWGYLALLQARTEAELQRGGSFVARSFHDELLAAGPMPPDLLRERLQREWLRNNLEQPG